MCLNPLLSTQSRLSGLLDNRLLLNVYHEHLLHNIHCILQQLNGQQSLSKYA